MNFRISVPQVRYRGAKADIDSPFFKLHYRTSATILFICCLLVTANEFWGSTIDCISNAIPGNVINNYCWIMSTFSVPSKLLKFDFLENNLFVGDCVLLKNQFEFSLLKSNCNCFSYLNLFKK